MINPNFLKENLKKTEKILLSRGFILNTEKFIFLEKKRKFLQINLDRIRNIIKTQSKIIAKNIINIQKINIIRQEVIVLKKKLHNINLKFQKIKKEIYDYISIIPNIPSKDVPLGYNDNQNIEIYKWGEKKIFIKDHITLGKKNNVLSFKKGVKLAGSKFVVMQGNLALLNRALIQFMLDLHTQKHGYKEIVVPYLSNETSLYSTGQLPKFEKELFHVYSSNNKKYSLIPTAEVPLVNLLRNKILQEDSLPVKMVSCTPCFRSEAGSYGKNTKGLIRMHQFDKVELVQIVNPENSKQVLEKITKHAENVLKLLNLPYRKMLLCTQTMSFSSSKTYDLEVWFPSKNNYIEVSSCSNVKCFQSRRMNSKFIRNKDKKLIFLHTLNGSALAIGRTLAAIMENYQTIEGKIKIPNVLRPYMRELEFL